MPWCADHIIASHRLCSSRGGLPIAQTCSAINQKPYCCSQTLEAAKHIRGSMALSAAVTMRCLAIRQGGALRSFLLPIQRRCRKPEWDGTKPSTCLRSPLLPAKGVHCARRAVVSGASSVATGGGVAELSPEEGLKILKDDMDTVVLDCDGVLWTGSKLLDGTIEALKIMRSLDKRMLFLTNNASKSRAQYKQKFDSLGIDVAPEEIVPASYCAAAYLLSIGFPPDKKVFLIGTSGVEEELREAGIDFVGGEENFVPAVLSGDDLQGVELDGSIGAVVVGFDPTFSYDKLAYASLCLREIPGCHFVVTNGDHGDNVGNGRIMPVTGSLSAAIERASGRLPVVVGKGGPWLLPWLCDKYDLTDPSRACIVGDRLDTGKEGGLRTFLPMTGVTTMHDLEKVDSAGAPDFWMPSLATLAGIQK